MSRSLLRRLAHRLAHAAAVFAIACTAGAPLFGARSAAKHAPPPRQKQPATSAQVVVIRGDSVERVRMLFEVAQGGRGRAVAASRAFGRVAASNGSGVRLYDFQGHALASIASCSPVLRGGIGFFGTKLIVACESAIEVYQVATAKKIDSRVLSLPPATACAINGEHVVLGHRDGVIRVHGLANQAPIEIKVPGPPIDVKSLALSRDATRVAAAWVQGSIWWWATDHPDQAHDLTRHESESDALGFNADASLLAEEGEPNFTTVWSLKTVPEKVTHVKNGSWIKRFIFLPDSTWLVRGGSDGLELAELRGARRVVLDGRSAVEDVALDEMSALIAAVDRDGRVTAWVAR